MKKLKTIMLAVSTAMFTANVAVQDMPESGIELNGLIIGHEYSIQQYYKALGGTPMLVRGPEEFDVSPNTYVMYYNGNDRFERIDKEFYGFGISNSRYVLNGKIRVGNNLSVVDSLEGGTVISNNFYEEDGFGVLVWSENEYPASVSFYYNKDNKIYRISAMILDL